MANDNLPAEKITAAEAIKIVRGLPNVDDVVHRYVADVLCDHIAELEFQVKYALGSRANIEMAAENDRLRCELGRIAGMLNKERARVEGFLWPNCGMAKS